MSHLAHSNVPDVSSKLDIQTLLASARCLQYVRVFLLFVSFLQAPAVELQELAKLASAKAAVNAGNMHAAAQMILQASERHRAGAGGGV